MKCPRCGITHIDCTNCEFSYMRFGKNNPGRGCQWEDLGAVPIPQTLRESRLCIYWELIGNVFVDFEQIKTMLS